MLHAPGSLCTYEPQWASDVFAMFQSLVSEVPDRLVAAGQERAAEDKQHDLDYLVSMMDWEANTVPDDASRQCESGIAREHDDLVS